MQSFKLEPINGEKSFYGKAIVIAENNVSKLKSYDTIVAVYNHETNEMRVDGWHSETTARHINAFLNYYGFDTCSKKELENYNQ